MSGILRNSELACESLNKSIEISSTKSGFEPAVIRNKLYNKF